MRRRAEEGSDIPGSILITGGAGFIGCNAAARFQEKGFQVVVIDNLSRRGNHANLRWLQKRGPLEFVHCDVRDFESLRAAIGRYPGALALIHLAGQVAVTTSVTDPRQDFEINALGTFNVLEAVRQGAGECLVLLASTNKVYGGMEETGIEACAGAGPDEKEGRYQYRDLPRGISETQLLDFHSPYGCSKGAADQYVRDYARIYGMRTVVFRQSCIYGPRQFGIEDQGWVAWFVISAVMGRPINIFGDGKQVRDVLHVSDLVDAYESAVAKRAEMTGRIFNIGGGPNHTMSILGLVHRLERLQGHAIPCEMFDWRPGDQPVYISDIRKAGEELSWKPKIDPETGVRSLLEWVAANRSLIEQELGDLYRIGS